MSAMTKTPHILPTAAYRESQRSRQFLRLFDRQRRLAPAAPAAVHRCDVGVTHLLQVVGGERRAKAAAAIQDDPGGAVFNGALDVALNDALAEMLCAWQVAVRPFTLFAHVDEMKGLAAVEHGVDVVDADFADPTFCLLDETEKSG